MRVTFMMCVSLYRPFVLSGWLGAKPKANTDRSTLHRHHFVEVLVDDGVDVLDLEIHGIW